MKNYIKYFASFLFIITMISCSKDDDAQPHETNKLLEQMNLDGILVSFFYNEDNSVKKVEISNSLYNFSYANDQISSIVVVDEDGEDEYLFQYDADGFIDSYSVNGQQVDVDYNSATRTYSYDANGNKISIVLYENDEIKEFIARDLENDEVAFHDEFLYDTSKKGPMYNSNSTFIQSYIANFGIAIFYNKYPIQIYTSNDQSFSFVNAFDEDEFVVRADAGTDIIDYFYSE